MENITLNLNGLTQHTFIISQFLWVRNLAVASLGPVLRALPRLQAELTWGQVASKLSWSSTGVRSRGCWPRASVLCWLFATWNPPCTPPPSNDGSLFCESQQGAGAVARCMSHSRVTQSWKWLPTPCRILLVRSKSACPPTAWEGLHGTWALVGRTRAYLRACPRHLLILSFFEPLLGARHCSKGFSYINSFHPT